MTAVAVSGLIAGGVVAIAGPANAETIKCDRGVNTFRWDGSANDTPGKVGDGSDWADAYNWNRDCTPGLRFQPGGQNDVVTIPDGANVFIKGSRSVLIAALHNNGALTVEPGAKLVVRDDSESNRLTLEGLLAGRGRFTVTGWLRWTSTAAGAATQTTRWCYVEDCSEPVAGRVGRTVIAKDATMVINGRGVNFWDQRIIENHGTVKLSGHGYIAADDGTALRNLRTQRSIGRFLIANNRGYYRGFSSKDLGYTTNLGLSQFVNTGRIIKTAGDGTSIINADYARRDPDSRYTGQVRVYSGTLNILGRGTATREAWVRGGSTFGNGGQPAACNTKTGSGCSRVTPTKEVKQVTTVQVTKTTPESTKVTLQKLVGGGGLSAVKIETSNVAAFADPNKPLRFRIMLDKSLVRQTGHTPAYVARNEKVYRNGDRLPNCGDSQNPTSARPTCVARDLSRKATKRLANGDVVMVVSSLQNSRYRVG